ncbi:MAG: hypothetical protein Q7J98_13140 [Kiritimatiellia bacterium]|nr:hypothetical protein [Kiritimatiellia bacterium]
MSFQEAVYINGLKEKIEKLKLKNTELKRKYGFTYCAYCGESFEVDAPNLQEAISKHITTCVKHPMRQLETENVRLKALCGDLWALREDLSIEKIHKYDFLKETLKLESRLKAEGIV